MLFNNHTMSAISPLAPAADAQGYLLLTIKNARVLQSYAGETIEVARGEMRLDCISLPIPAALGHQTANPFAPSPSDPAVPTHDFWLVIKFPESSFELPLIPSHQMNISRNAGEIGYSIPSNEIQGASLLLRFPAPKDGVEVEEVQGLEDLLYQYGCLDRDLSALGGTPGVEPASQPADMRGKLVLMNEDSGQILGEFDQSLDIEEDRKVGEDGREKQPVVLDFGAVVNGQMVGEVVVKTVPEDELDDWMLRGAHFLSRGILSAGSAASKGLLWSGQYVVNNTTPNAQPTVFSDSTKSGIRSVHNASAATGRVTKQTVNAINGVITTLVEKTTKTIKEKTDDSETEDVLHQPPGRRTSSSLPPLSSKPMIPVPYEPRRKSPVQRPPTPPKRGLLSRVILAGEVVLTSLEASVANIVTSGTAAASTAAGHKYGPDAGHATALIGGSVRNVTVVYIDVRGVGRRALLKSTAKGFIKTRMKDGRQVTLQGSEAGPVSQSDNKDDLVVVMGEIGQKEKQA